MNFIGNVSHQKWKNIGNCFLTYIFPNLSNVESHKGFEDTKLKCNMLLFLYMSNIHLCVIVVFVYCPFKGHNCIKEKLLVYRI